MKKGIVNTDENPFALSIGDIMAALLLVFILLLTTTVLQLKDTMKKTQERVNQAERYINKRDDLAEALNTEFSDNLKEWGAEIDTTTLSVRFNSPDVLFAMGSAELRPGFEQILDDFLPRYIGVITRPEFRDDLEEIRIEGHSSRDWGKGASEDESYFGNMGLSQERTRAVLSYLFDQELYRQPQLSEEDNKQLKDWSRAMITANGLSFSKPFIKDGEEDAKRSRRVEFRVKIDADKQIREMIKVNQFD